jgi:DNA-binding NtrC family response regulator
MDRRIDLPQGTLDLLILKTLEATNNNKTRAAEILAISLKTLHNKLKEYGNAAADAALVREE